MLGLIEQLVEMPRTRLWFGIITFNKEEMPLQYTWSSSEKGSCTVKVSTVLLMAMRLCRSVPYMVRVPLHMLEKLK